MILHVNIAALKYKNMVSTAADWEACTFDIMAMRRDLSISLLFLFIIYLLYFGPHQQCSELILGSALRDHSFWG